MTDDDLRLLRIRKQLANRWDDAAGETTAEFLLRLLDQARSSNDLATQHQRDRARWKLANRA